jgi:transposase-like protein
MAKPLTDDERERIADAIRSGKARNEIAREFGRSPSTITAIAVENDLSFDRSATKEATEARKADVDARMLALMEDLLGDAERMRTQLWKPCTIHSFGGKDNTYASKRIPEPTFADKRNIVGSVRMLTTTVTDIRGRIGGQDRGKSLIEQLVEGLAAA